MIRIIGIIHVLDLTSKVFSAIDYFSPEAVCIELDRKRLDAMLSGEYRTNLTIPGIMSYIQRRIALSNNIIPGSEMLAAYKKSVMNGIPVFTVDDDADEIYAKIGKIPIKEKSLLLLESLFSIIFSRRYSLDELVENEEYMLEKFEKRYPYLYRYLVFERNRNMAERIVEIERKYGNVLAFAGDAHLNGLKELIPHAEMIRLRDFLRMYIPNTTFKFSIKIS